MDVRWIHSPGETLCRSHSDGFAFLLPLPKAPKDSWGNAQGLLTLKKIQGGELAQSSNLQYLLDELGAEKVAEGETLLPPSVEDLEHHRPAKVLYLNLPRSVSIKYLLPLRAAKDVEPRTCQVNTLATLPARILSFIVEKDLPPEIRTDSPLPPVVATLKGLDLGEGETPFDSGNLWGQVSLASADGRVAMARVVPDILSGTTVAPLIRNNSQWSLVFDDLVIRRPGYFKIYIALMQTSQREDEDRGEPTIEAPQELLGAVTSLIYVHAFAPMPGRKGKRNTSLAFFTSHERSLLKSTWGSQATRLSRDSFLPFASCQLCLQIARDPVACASKGDIFCRECVVNNLLAQGKEIKRLKKEDERRQEEAEESELERGTEERARAIESFERTMMGFEGNAKAIEKGNVPAISNGEAEDLNEGRGVKRKFELNENEMLKNAKEERAKARKALDDEKSRKPTLPSFWVPSLTPSTNNQQDVKPPKLSPLCPASLPETKHTLSLKSLVTINFKSIPNSKSSTGSPTIICPACDKNLTNTVKAVLTVPCGHVLCKPCAAKFMSPDTGPPDPHASATKQEEGARVVCYVCETDVSGRKVKAKEGDDSSKSDKGGIKSGLVELRSEGTGFAGGGNNIAQRKGVAFQC